MTDEQKQKPLIYLDHAATSWPKPVQVVDAVTHAIAHGGANPGRGSHQLAVQASRVMFQTRKQLAKLFGVANPVDIVFSDNTTTALNLAIKGWVKPGDHVVATMVEHNSVRRPLEYLKRTIGIEVTYVEANAEGEITPEQIKAALNNQTTLVVASHSSNLLGSILPLADIGAIVKAHSNAKLLVDAAQSAGKVHIDVQSMQVDMLAFPGHKGLLGPQGTGGLYISPELDLEPLHHGGTGSQSEAAEQPSVRPDRYEAGTQNVVGLAGLEAGVKLVLAETTAHIFEQELSHVNRMIEGLQSINGVKVLGPALGKSRTGIAAFLVKHADPSEIAYILDQHYGIAVRAGFHCTPLGHQAAGTYESGAVRASVGYTTTKQEVEALIGAVQEIVRHY